MEKMFPSASEQSAEVFCLEQAKLAKTKTEDTFIANEQDSLSTPNLKKRIHRESSFANRISKNSEIKFLNIRLRINFIPY